MKRRHFLGNMAISGVAAGLSAKRVSASDTVTVGLMGCGGRGTLLISTLAKRPDVRIKYICDVNQDKFARTTAAVEDITGDMPKRIKDFRTMLDDPELDIMINATPHHWHGLGTVIACQAGKHVYVEKPVSQNIWEGRKMVEAARKYNCKVQGGMQNRSAEYLAKAREYIKSGKLGAIHQVRVMNMLNQSLIHEMPKEIPVPDGLDYDMLLGPAQKVPYRGKWPDRKFWNLGAGNIWDDAVHQFDIARWMIGKHYPDFVHSSGGVYMNGDGRECPDTQVATWEYDDLLLHLHASTHMPYLKKTPHPIRASDQHPEWLTNATRVEIFGTDGMMIVGRQGGGWVTFGKDGGEMDRAYGRNATPENLGNLIDAIRTGATLNADIELAHISTAMAHMSDISLRLNGRQLRFDGKKETFPDDRDAAKLCKREYRKPWVIPEQV
jgi:predicted dehydrogenase